MISKDFKIHEKLAELREREKEMKCLYKVQEIINQNLPVDKFLMLIVKHIWGGWQYPMITRVKILFEGKEYREPGWQETEWMQKADIIIDDNILGRIEVYYTHFKKIIFDSQFLPEEQKLLNTIAAKVSSYIFNNRLIKTVEILEAEKKEENIEDALQNTLLTSKSDSHWIWRNEMANKIADKIDLNRFGLKAIYLIGSVKNASAGPASDIDMLFYFTGDKEQKKELIAWLEGWSLCLSEMNFLKTGYHTEGLIDEHIITDDDIHKNTSFASMIGAITDGAKLLKSV